MVLGPSPLQQQYLDRLAGLVSNAAARGRGRVVFLAGQAGSGRSYWFNVAGERVRDARVLSGGFAKGEYVPRDLGRQAAVSADAAALIKSIAGLGQFAGPIGSLIAQLVSVSVNAYRFLDGLRNKTMGVEVHELLPRLLRIAGSEHRSRPLVCLIDDADTAEGNWWTNLLLSFAQEIEQELPLVLVMGINGPQQLPDVPREQESGACGVARSLLGRAIGEWWGFRALSREEVASWIGPASAKLRSAVWEITEGDAGEIAGLWESWVRRGAIARDDQDRWQIVGSVESTFAEAGDRVNAQLATLLGEENVQLLENVRQVLACAALEGRTFTAEAVARALDWDYNDLINLLDDHLCGDDGPLREAPSVSILRVGTSSRPLWRYSFIRNLDWRIVRARFASVDERRSLAQRLAAALIDTYSPEEHRVAGALTALLVQAGDTNAAAHYRRIANLGVDHVILRAQARYLMSARTEGWTRWDLTRAAELLLHATSALSDVDPYQDTLELADASAQLAERAGARVIQAEAIWWQARAHLALGIPEEARQDLMRARDVGREMTPRWLQARMFFLRGSIEFQLGRFDAAREPTERALTISQEIGDRVGEENSWAQLGQIEMGLGRLEAAREPIERALTISQELGHRAGEAAHWLQLGQIEIGLGRFDAAREPTQRLLTISQEIGDRYHEAHGWYQLGAIEIGLGRFDAAREPTERASTIFEEIGNREGAARCKQLLDDLDHRQ